MSDTGPAVQGMPWLLGAAALWFSGFALLLPVAPLWVIRGGIADRFGATVAIAPLLFAGALGLAAIAFGGGWALHRVRLRRCGTGAR